MTLDELIVDLHRLRKNGPTYGSLDVVNENDNMIIGVEYNNDGGDPVIVLVIE